ncbi:MAG TPA: class I SAM-dependent methyltransferase [Candidatus Polarisedimenticolia bacterium]|nr:class I SAM-dependent methyltransferase [Candidatus Polarisedimenticolia bacterium]
MKADWYEEFFEGITLDFWRKVMPKEQTSVEADFLERALQLRPGAEVLDVPCGAGRHSIELAARGHRMTGVDQSRDWMEEARARATAAGVNVEWRRAEMRDLPWESRFDAAFCFGNSFGVLDIDGTRAFVKAVARALKPGARFALDCGMTAESILPNLRDREWTQVDDILFLEENRYHATQGCYETTYTFVRDGKTDTRTGLHWVFMVREIRGLLAEAGLIPEEPLTSLDGEPFRTGSRYLILVAQKS